MKSTIHKCVLNAFAAPNTIQCNQLGKYTVEERKIDWFKLANYIDSSLVALLFAIGLLLDCC